jgi:cytochrome c oxidase cbb3-type subunit 4
MENYSLLRQFADSWVLLLMAVFYVGAILWVFRPGARKIYDDVANIPLRNETAEPSCVADSATCKCSTPNLEALK